MRDFTATQRWHIKLGLSLVLACNLLTSDSCCGVGYGLRSSRLCFRGTLWATIRVAQRTLGSGQIRKQTPTGFYIRHGVHRRKEGRRRLIGRRRGVHDCAGTANIML
jgi:hypothetical protein